MAPGTKITINLPPHWEQKWPKFYSNFQGREAIIDPQQERTPDGYEVVVVKGWEKQGYLLLERSHCARREVL